MTVLTQVSIPLAVPVPVQGADGKPAERTTLVLGRPKARHAKRLAVLLGADLIQAIAGAGDGKATEIDVPRLVGELVPKLLTDERLDALTALLADLCGEQPATIDELDTADLAALLKGLFGFFPSLQSFATSVLQPSSPSDTDGSPI
jgi:hypothetical protein